MCSARRLLGGIVLVAGLFGAGLLACGGSSSESPWPVEPLDTEPGPAGEDLTRGNVIATEDLPDNYGKGGGGPESEEDDED